MKSTYLFLFAFFLISINSVAQKASILITLKTGETFQTQKLSEKKDVLKFEDDKGDSQSINLSKIETIVSTGKKEKNNYTKRYIMYSKSKGDLMEEVVNGFAKLYKRTEFKMSGVGAMGAPTTSTFIDYYVKKDNEPIATYLQGSNVAYGSYRKNVKEYFKDCEALLVLANDDNFKRSKINEIVEFYNSNCATK